MFGGALELMLILTAVAMTYLAAVPLLQDQQYKRMGAVAAWQQQAIAGAVNTYVRDNWATVYATATSPIVLPLSTLQAAGYWPSNIGAGNPWHQSFVIVLSQAGANQLTGYVATTGGNPIPVNVLHYTATLTGPYGAYVPYSPVPAP